MMFWMFRLGKMMKQKYPQYIFAEISGISKCSVGGLKTLDTFTMLAKKIRGSF